LLWTFKFHSILAQPQKKKIQNGLYLAPILISISKNTTYLCVLLCHAFKL